MQEKDLEGNKRGGGQQLGHYCFNLHVRPMLDASTYIWDVGL
jgi:hypothetical protein